MNWRPTWGVLVLMMVPGPADGQQASVSSPFTRFRSGFYERIGVNWGFEHIDDQSMFFFHGPGFGPPPLFGGFDPGAASFFVLSGRRGGWSWSLGITADQGSSQSLVSEVPSLTLTPGVPGYLFDGTWRPFVTGFLPVVGGQPEVNYPLHDRIQRWRESGAWEEYLMQQAEEDSQAAIQSTKAQESKGDSPTKHRRIEDPPLRLGIETGDENSD